MTDVDKKIEKTALGTMNVDKEVIQHVFKPPQVSTPLETYAKKTISL